MKFYVLHKFVEIGCSGGFEWFTSKRAAEAAKREHIACMVGDDISIEATSIEMVDIKPTRAGILEALNIHASHERNG